ncbi:hypothetical protein M378DRAFT_18331 [Amanita muscaria Koide BX008]|uniref:Ty3 transposon capsid-like protein domain-containing protein n=1 Tax=Amanita muscaria (strain Koide BX008) TaxID=946122 RepID=A0A0C2W1M7_AMAMK|nr:hypothetical protein M378DRAFT_18331 [Amanita muscaria Koide BX008]
MEHIFEFLSDEFISHPYLWYYLISNHQVPCSEFFIPQTAGRLPSGSVIHEGCLYFDEEEIYFDHDTRCWRSREGNNPLPDELFLGPGYVPGNPEEALPDHLRTQSTAYSANTESSDEEGTSGTDNALEYVSADQEEDTELEQQEEEGNQSETHLETVVPPTPLTVLFNQLCAFLSHFWWGTPLKMTQKCAKLSEIDSNLELLQIEPPVVPIATETPDVEMSQAPPQNNYQGGGGGVKLPLPEDFTGAYFNFYPNQFTSDAQKITLTLMSCKGAALTWRDSEFAKFDTDPVSHGTWNEFRTRFINQWEEVSAMVSAMIKIQKLKLGGKYNMNQLISRFDKLIPYCRIQDNEPMKIHFFNQCFPNEDPQKIAFTLLLLEGNALTWRDTELKKLPLKTEGTWVQFKEHFSKQWDEVNSEGVALNAIKRLKLTSSFKMDRLTARFDELIPYCKLDDNPFMQIEFFVNTLTPEIQKHILLQNPKTYEEARQAAVQYGIANDRMDISAGRKPRFGVSGFNHSSSSHKDPYAMDVDAIDLEEEGTNIRFTKLSPSQIEEYKNQGKCFNCGQRGHMS